MGLSLPLYASNSIVKSKWHFNGPRVVVIVDIEGYRESVRPK